MKTSKYDIDEEVFMLVNGKVLSLKVKSISGSVNIDSSTDTSEVLQGLSYVMVDENGTPYGATEDAIYGSKEDLIASL